MTTRVNGGVKVGQALIGDLTYFKIANAAFLAADLGTVNTDGSAKPIEVAARVIATKGTIVILNVVDGLMYVALENTSQGWTAATLDAALDAVVAGNTVTQYDELVLA